MDITNRFVCIRAGEPIVDPFEMGGAGEWRLFPNSAGGADLGGDNQHGIIHNRIFVT